MTTYTAAPAKMHSGHDIRNASGHMVAIVHNPKANSVEGARIAALMAAAPELLEAARRALDYIESVTYESSIHPSTRAQDALNDAIARATGATL